MKTSKRHSIEITPEIIEAGSADTNDWVACNLCGSASSTLVLRANTQATDLNTEAYACTSPHVGKHGRIVSCNTCGLVYANPRPTREAVDDLYSAVEDSTYLEEEAARVATFRHSLVGVRKYAPGGLLLDVGCHVGTFLDVARKGGYETVGVEPSGWAAEYARQRGLKVYTGGLEEADLAPESLDVVTVWDVIEHFTDPLQELRSIRRVLRPGGVLALSTMNVDSPLPKLMKGRWPWYMLMHLYYFTPRTITAMLEKAGFEVLDIEPHIRVVHVRYLVSKLEAYSRPLSRAARWVTEGLRIGGVRLPVNFGDLMTVYARKV